MSEFTFQDQLRIEAIGAKAGLNGATRKDCPYNKETHPKEWNHWVYGCEVAAGEKEVVERGFVEFCNVETGKMWSLPVGEAIARGIWKPRYVRLDEEPI